MSIIYKWLMSGKSQEITANIKEYINIIEEYKLYENNTPKNTIDTSEDKYYIYKGVVEDKVSYNIFYDNLHIRLETSPKESVYSFHLKVKSDSWGFKKNDNSEFDLSHPTTSTFRVFVSYDVPVLNITRASGESYVNGNWDKYVYKTINKFDKLIRSCTDKAQFNEEYKDNE